MYMVARWACEVTEIITQKHGRRLFCARITVSSHVQLTTKYKMHISVSIVYDTLSFFLA